MIVKTKQIIIYDVTFLAEFTAAAAPTANKLHLLNQSTLNSKPAEASFINFCSTCSNWHAVRDLLLQEVEEITAGALQAYDFCNTESLDLIVIANNSVKWLYATIDEQILSKMQCLAPIKIAKKFRRGNLGAMILNYCAFYKKFNLRNHLKFHEQSSLYRQK